MKKKRGTKATANDERTQLALLREWERQRAAKIEALEKKILNERHYYPRKGSKWKKHSALAQPHEMDYVWTFLFWCWGDISEQLYVMRTEIDGEPFTKAFSSRTHGLEHVPADKATEAQVKSDQRKHEAARKKNPELYGEAP